MDYHVLNNEIGFINFSFGNSVVARRLEQSGWPILARILGTRYHMDNIMQLLISLPFRVDWENLEVPNIFIILNDRYFLRKPNFSTTPDLIGRVLILLLRSPFWTRLTACFFLLFCLFFFSCFYPRCISCHRLQCWDHRIFKTYLGELGIVCVTTYHDACTQTHIGANFCGPQVDCTSIMSTTYSCSFDLV